MTRTDILSEALAMVDDARRGRRSAFADALLTTMSGAGDFHAKLAVPTYPRDAQRRDLERIGEDMYRALGKHAELQAPSS